MISALRVIIATTASLFATPGFASDMLTKAPSAPIVAPPYNWSGLYLGANLGGRWANGALTIPGNNLYGGLTDFIGGGQVGYNFQAGHLLLGVEGDLDWAGFNHPTLPLPTLGSVNHRWMGTAAGRIGVTNDRWLVFGKLGIGWAHHDISVSLPGLLLTESSNQKRLAGGWRN